MSGGAPPGVSLPEGVVQFLPEYLGRQRWFKGDVAPRPDSVTVVDVDHLASTAGGAHRLLWVIVAVAGAGSDGADGGGEEARYQLLIGERPNGEIADFLNGHESGVLGSAGDRYYYDATLDPELSLAWLSFVTSEELLAERVRPVQAEQSNTSLVYDNKLIAKVFRRLHEGRNPDVEVTEALTNVGFEHVAQPVAVWQRDGTDLAFVQQFLAGGTEGWALALASLRNLYSVRAEDPGDAGGDFAHEAARLGQVTAEMHLAMAEAFGVDRQQFRNRGWPAVLDEVDDQLRAVAGASGSGQELIERLRAVDDPGPAIRVHGDYHLGQVMRTDGGWYVLDFEGEPARAKAERLVFTSPFKDVTGMVRSLHYASHFVLLEQEAHEQEQLAPLAERWERRNRDAFLDGYFGTDGIAVLLPERPEVRDEVSLAFELQKALYELSYERAYRPGWIPIPTAAIQRMLAGSYSGLEG
ncbi:MAG TPA: phosphotransferase [Acidimicrobiales bacterium]|nr:phosphotransferase [Acidimicrobiales bacterium]